MVAFNNAATMRGQSVTAVDPRHRTVRVLAGLVVTALIASMSVIGAALPATAAISPDEHWVTDVTGTGATGGTITFGTSGVTGTLSSTPAAAKCAPGPNEGSSANLTQGNANAFYSPQAPANAVPILECLNDNPQVGSRTVVLSKPIAGLMFHIYNLDGSYLDFQAATGGGAIVLETVKKNVALQLQNGGTRLWNSVVAGNAACSDDPAAAVNPGCGSFRMTEGGGAVEQFSFLNPSRTETTSRDGWVWSMSFHQGSLTKAFSPAVIPLGSISTLTLTVTNPTTEGATTFSDVDFSDALPAGVVLADSTATLTNCGPGVVNGGVPVAGQTSVSVTGATIVPGVNCTVAVHVTSAATGTYQNTNSNITTSIGNIIPNANATLQVIAATTGLALDKSAVLSADANGNGLADAGDQITYSFDVENTGNTALDDVVINDPRISGTTPASVDLAAGGSATLVSAPYTVVEADVMSGAVRNTATASGVYNSLLTPVPVVSNTSSAVVPVPSIPGLSLEKTAELNDTNGNGLADVGETIVYRFLVRNVGNTAVDDVTIADDRISGTTPASADLPVFGEQEYVSTPYQVTQADVDAGGITNVASAVGVGPGNTPVTSPEDSEFVGTSLRAPALTLDKTAELNDTNGNDVADLGESIDYAFVVENTGNVTLDDVTITDPRVTGVTPSSATIAPGDSVIFTAVPYAVVQADLNTGSVNNTAVANATSPIGPVQSNTDSTSTPTTTPDPELALEKTAVISTDANGNGMADPGDTITYTFHVTNTGTVDLTGVTVDDPRVTTVTPAAADIPANGSADFTATYVATQADVDFGSIPNTATATGVYINGGQSVTVTSAPDTATVPTPVRAPALSIQKDGILDDVNGNSVADVGETIDYTFVVDNTGNVTLDNVTVIDDRVSGITPASVTLAPNGGQQSFSADPYTVTQADVDAGEVLNVAYARGNPPGGAEINSAPANHVVETPAAEPSLAIDKVGTLIDENDNGTADAGETINYAFTVTNTGNVTLANVFVVDDRISALMPEGIDFLPPAAAFEFEAAPYVVGQADMAGEAIVNVAHAEGTAPTGAVVESEEDSTSTPVTQPVPPTPPTQPQEPPALAVTGGGVAWTAGVLAVLMLLAGAAAILIVRRRHPLGDSGAGD